MFQNRREYGYAPGGVFLMVNRRSEHKMSPFEICFSNVFIGKIVFSYSYRFAELIFPPCEKAFRRAVLLEEDRIWQRKTSERGSYSRKDPMPGIQVTLKKTTTYPATMLETAATGSTECFPSVATNVISSRSGP